MSEKALRMLRYMRRQILGQPAPYVEVRRAAIGIGVDPGGIECGGLVDELLRAGYIQRYPSASLNRARALPPHRPGQSRGRGCRWPRSATGSAQGPAPGGLLDGTDPEETARIVARALPDVAKELASLTREANSLRGTEYATLRFRMEAAHAAVEAALIEARRRVRINEGKER